MSASTAIIMILIMMGAGFVSAVLTATVYKNWEASFDIMDSNGNVIAQYHFTTVNTTEKAAKEMYGSTKRYMTTLPEYRFCKIVESCALKEFNSNTLVLRGWHIKVEGTAKGSVSLNNTCDTR